MLITSVHSRASCYHAHRRGSISFLTLKQCNSWTSWMNYKQQSIFLANDIEQKISSYTAKFIMNNKSLNFVTAFDFNIFDLAHMSCSKSVQSSKSFHGHRTMIIELDFSLPTQHIFDTSKKWLVVLQPYWAYNDLLVSTFVLYLPFSLLWESIWQACTSNIVDRSFKSWSYGRN